MNNIHKLFSALIFLLFYYFSILTLYYYHFHKTNVQMRVTVNAERSSTSFRVLIYRTSYQNLLLVKKKEKRKKSARSRIAVLASHTVVHLPAKPLLPKP